MIPQKCQPEKAANPLRFAADCVKLNLLGEMEAVLTGERAAKGQLGHAHQAVGELWFVG